jgi:DNA-binding transcriptional regulator LsrR (DeoR family)
MAPFDAEGRLVAPGFAARTIGFEVAKLSRVPVAIGVAAGPSKVTPLRAALTAPLFNVLVTDVATAEAILGPDARGLR